MTPETPIPVFQSPDATTAVPAPVGCKETTMPVSVANAAAQMPVQPSAEVKYCDKVKLEIRFYGVEKAMARWRVICDYMQTEDWWPAVARAVEKVFDKAYKERDLQQQAERLRQQQALVNLTLSQALSNRDEKTDNHFGNGSSNQVFNGDVEGNFTK